MEYSDIKRLLDDMGNSKVDSLDIEFPDGTKIKMKKNEAKIIEAIEPRPVPAVKEVTLPAEAKEEPKAVVATENYKEVKSPMVGTFYTGYKGLKAAHKYFAFGSLICMIMAVYSGHKMISGNKRTRKQVENTKAEE